MQPLEQVVRPHLVKKVTFASGLHVAEGVGCGIPGERAGLDLI